MAAHDDFIEAFVSELQSALHVVFDARMPWTALQPGACLVHDDHPNLNLPVIALRSRGDSYDDEHFVTEFLSDRGAPIQMDDMSDYTLRFGNELNQ
jgi:hypothetical protein